MKKVDKIIDDFLDVDGNLLPHYIFQHKFNRKVCIMQYNNVVCATSTYLKSYLTKKIIHQVYHSIYSNILLFAFQNKCTNVVYRQLNSSNVIPTSIPKWDSELVPYGAEICVNGVFNVYIKTTKDTQLQWLQYRLLYRILPVIYYLNKSM